MDKLLKKSFKFDICESHFEDKTRLNVAFHQSNQPFQCKVCDYRSSQKANLNRHVALVHEQKRTLQCEMCDYSSSLKHV